MVMYLVTVKEEGKVLPVGYFGSREKAEASARELYEKFNSTYKFLDYELFKEIYDLRIIEKEGNFFTQLSFLLNAYKQ